MESKPRHDRERGVVHELSDDDVQFAVDLGRERDDSMSFAGRGVDPGDRTKIHVRGAKAEVAVARYWNIAPHDKVGGPDDGVDYRVNVNGVDADVDVKAKPGQYWGDEDLFVERKHVDRVGVFVLTCVDGRKVRLVGYLPARDVNDFDADVTPDGRTLYRVPGGELKPVPTPDEVTQL